MTEEPWEIAIDATNPVTQEREAAARSLQAQYDGMERVREYQSRTLHVPDGQIRHAHYDYHRPYRGMHRGPSRHYSRQRGRQRQTRERGYRENIPITQWKESMGGASSNLSDFQQLPWYKQLWKLLKHGFAVN